MYNSTLLNWYYYLVSYIAICIIVSKCSSQNIFISTLWWVFTCCVFRPANACLHMHSHGRKRQKTFKNDEKSIFYERHKRGLRRKTKKSLFASVFFVFLCESLVSLSCAWWKRYFFIHFQVFSIVFDHVNACASMHSLVEIHNTQVVHWDL